MAGRNNTAYNFEMFEQDYEYNLKRAKELEKNKKPKIMSTVANIKFANRRKYVRFILAVGYALVISFALLYANVQLTEVNTDLAKQKDTLATMQSENSSLNSVLDNMMSMKSIEMVAKEEYGMIDAPTNQVQYVSLKNENKAEVINENTGIFSNVLRIYDKVKEYISNM